jgi:polysaccharide pyruvyl transferase WcaK-like protein
MTSLPGPILIVGGYGYRNVGDEAILAGLLVELGRADVTVVSRDPQRTRQLHGVRSVSFAAAPFELLRHGSVVVGGGGLFGAHMGRLGRFLPQAATMATKLGKPLLVTGIGVDPDMPVAQAEAVAAMLRRATSVTVRDTASAGVVTRWGIGVMVAPDLSARMAPSPPEAAERLLRELGIPIGRPVIGLALTDVEPEIGERMLRAAEAAMVRYPQLEFCFIPMSRHPSVPTHDDALIAERLRQRQPRLRILSAERPADVLAVYGRLSAAIVMRFHGLLFAERAGIPTVAVPYAPKVREWLASHAMPATVPTAEAVVRALGDAFQARILAASAAS